MKADLTRHVRLMRISILIFMDALFISVALYLSVLMRYGPGIHIMYLDRFTGATLVSYFAYFFSFYVFGFYDLKSEIKRVYSPTYTLLACISGCVIIAIVSFLFPPWKIARSVFTLQAIFLFALFGVRGLAVWALSKTTIVPAKRVIIVGDNAAAHDMLELLKKDYPVDFNILGMLYAAGERAAKPERLGRIQDVRRVVNAKRVDLVICCIPRQEIIPISSELLAIKSQGCEVVEMPSIYGMLTGRVPIEHIQDDWFIYGPYFSDHKNILYLNISRFLDIVFAVLLLCITLPVWLLTMVLIKLTMPGPVFYMQTRSGLNRRPFRILKFRSMFINAEKGGLPVWSGGFEDNRVTVFGRFLRRTRIDELPQLINVIKGEMSFIGPRPERPYFVNKLSAWIPYYGLRFTVKPGLTGWAQVNMGYANDEESSRLKLAYDLFYIQQNSLTMNLIILIKTVQTILTRPGS